MFDAENIDDSLLVSTNDRAVVEKEWDAFYSSAVSHAPENVRDQPKKSLPPQCSKSVENASGNSKRGSPTQLSSQGSARDNCIPRTNYSHVGQMHIHHPSFMGQSICKGSAPCWTIPNCMPHPAYFQVDPRGCCSYQPGIQNPHFCHLKPVKPTIEPQVSKPQVSNPQVSKSQHSANGGFVQVDNEIFLQKQGQLQ